MASCKHEGSKTKHTSSSWDYDVNPATDRQEPWRRYSNGWTTCDDCGDTVAISGTVYDRPRW